MKNSGSRFAFDSHRRFAVWTMVATTALSIGVRPLSSAELAKPTGDAIVSPDAKLELLYTRSAQISGGLTEGPAVAPDGSIYFSDIPVGKDGGLIVRFDPSTKQSTIFTADSGKSNGMVFDKEGYLVACEGADLGGRRISRWNVKTKERSTLVDNFHGKKFNSPNDICIDSKGRLYFTDPKYLGDEKRELEHRAVYRIDGPGKVVEVTHDISKPNGIGISPDEKTLYVADHDNGTDRIDPNGPKPKPGPMKIYAFPISDRGEVNGPRRTIVDFGDQAGCDGMCVDERGNLFLTARGLKRPGVLVVDPHGKEVAFIPTGPANQSPGEKESAVGLPSNVEFGIGKEANMLYVTIDLSLYRIPVKTKGYLPQFAK